MEKYSGEMKEKVSEKALPFEQGIVTEKKKKSELKPNDKRGPVDPLRYINAATFPSVP